MNIGENLRKIREQFGYSQTKLGKMLNINQQNISWWELGHNMPTIEDIVRLANFYNVSIDELIGR